MAVSCMRYSYGYNYSNSWFIVELAMGQIKRSTERISSFSNNFVKPRSVLISFGMRIH